MKKPALVSAVLAALALVGTFAPPAQADVETIDLKPAQLQRGPNGAVPHVDGNDLVVGDQRFAFQAPEVRYLGRSGDDYVVATWRYTDDRNPKVVRVRPSDERSVVLTDVPVWELTLSQDGQQLVRPRYRSHRERTIVRVWNALDGSVLTTRAFPGFINVLAADESRMVLSSWSPNRTFWWNTSSDATRRLSDRVGYSADIRADRLAVVTRDPYDGGCSVVSTLSDPDTRLWRSCDQAVMRFSPSGSRMATQHLLADGPGPGQVEVHKAGGKLLARYSSYWFSDLTWESDDSLLLLTNGRRRSAWVRCVLDDCERASGLHAAPVPRPAARS